MKLTRIEKSDQALITLVPVLVLVSMMLCAVPVKAQEAGQEQAQEELSVQNRAALLGIARNFVRQVRYKFEQAENEIEQKDPLEGIPDGDQLIFRFRVLDDAKRVPIEGDAFALKEGRELFMSLRDFVSVLYFPIQFDPDTKSAHGWYIKEANEFTLDWPSRSVVTAAGVFDIPANTIEEGDDLMVSLNVLGSWFNMDLIPNISGLLIDIESAERLPLIDRLARRKRDVKGYEPPEPELPRKDDDYLMAEVPVADLTLGVRHRKPPKTSNNRESTTVGTATLQAAGDVLGHTGEIYASGDSEERIRNVRVTLSKDSEEPELLGPLKARRYEVGDIVTTNMPIFSTGGQELGARVTNRKTGSSTSFTQTNFFGDLPPDWDVELYRNNQLVDFLTVGEDGRYEFRNVALFEGDNLFRFVYYGPQGERREEEKSIPVDLTQIQDEGIYDISVSAQDTTTYENPEMKRSEHGDVSVSATYEQPLGNGYVGIAGLKQRTYGEDQKLQALAGVTKNFDGTLVNANIGVDQNGESAIEATARRRLGEHDLRASGFLATDKFSPTEDSDDPTVLSTGIDLKGPLFEIDHKKIDYAFHGDYTESATGSSRLQLSHNMNADLRPVRVNHTLNYRRQPDSSDPERLTSTLALSGTALKTSWRATANYDYKPEAQLDSTFLKLSRNVLPGVRAGYELEYHPDPSYTKNSLEATWQTKNFSITPKVSLDSEDELQAYLTTRFGLIRDPRSGEVDMTRARNTGSGSVSAFVFLDKNGDGIYNEDEEPIKDARIDSMQTRRYGITDENGYALITGLREYASTDIRLDVSSLSDPFWIPGTSGNSIHPRPGHNVSMDFPVHQSGEIDGTIWATRQGRREGVRNLTLVLYDQDGRKVQTAQTAYDGFYLFTLVPPGSYYLTTQKEDIEALKLIAPPPEKIEIGYDGTVIYGKDFMLQSSETGGAAFTVVSGYDDLAKRNQGLSIPALSAGTVVLNLGSFRSNLLMATTWYEIRTRTPYLFGKEYALVKPSESLPDIDTNMHSLRVYMPGLTIDEAYSKCRSLSGRGYECNVEYLPKGFDPQNI